MLSLRSVVGPRRVELVKLWSGSAGKFLVSGVALGLFLTEWRVVCEKIPFYGGKFKEDQ